NGLRLFAGAADGRLYAFDKGSSLSIWANQYAAPFSGQLTVFGDRIYVAGDAVTLFALDQATGHVAWRYRTRSSISCPVTVTDGALFTPLSTDSAIVLGLKDGKPVNTLQLDEENSSSAAPIAVANAVIVATPHRLLAFAAPQ